MGARTGSCLAVLGLVTACLLACSETPQSPLDAGALYGATRRVLDPHRLLPGQPQAP